MSRLVDHLHHARHYEIVGRNAEKQFFCTLLEKARGGMAAGEIPPFYLLFIYGPGGVGKSTLLREFTRLAQLRGARPVYLDARTIEPAPNPFALALTDALGLEAGETVADALATSLQTIVLLLDTFEHLAPLEPWLRNDFLPQLPEQMLVVIAGRNPPAPEWRLDPGWRSVLHQRSLRNLSVEESQFYLTQRGVPAGEQPAVLAFTHGHPLALSLLADVFAQRPGVHFQPADVPDVLQTLMEQFAQKVPGPAHRVSLEACALVRAMTEGLLAAILQLPDAHELFKWLRGLSFVECGPQGIFLHDLARETLLADLRWRNPDWYAELHRRARTYYTLRLQQIGPSEQQQVLHDFLYLHRDNALVRPFYEWQDTGATLAMTMTPADVPGVVGMVREHEGEEAARQASHWIERLPDSFHVYRGGEQQVTGFLQMLPLEQVTEADDRMDPVVGSVRRYLRGQGSLRSGETATFFRFWMTRERYQSVSSLQSQIFLTMVRHYLTTPGLAHTFLPCAEPDFWAPMFAYADLARLPELDFRVGDRSFGIYGHDWRAVPPMAWLELMGQREMGSTPVTPPQPRERILVLDAADFAAAVQEAFKGFTRSSLLRSCPLLRSRLVIERVGLQADEATRIAALQAALREVAASLQSSPREMKLYRVLHHTYFQPAATQEVAAELLDLPFGTYRRHLKAGVERVTELLWQQEVEGQKSEQKVSIF